ncbi:MAG: PorT family protein [Rikenellaceae bacterium]|jgi:hypothetical protein|nr:PorT family protein [Rikenellaceae bacterium]
MIKKLTITCLLLLTAASVLALSPVKFGISGGASIQNIDLGSARAGDYALSAESSAGYYAGMSMRVTIPKFYIQPEINYIHNSYKLTAATPSGSSSYSTVKLNSLELPVLVGMRFLHFFRLQVGPVFNLMNETSVSVSRSTTNDAAPAHSVTYAAPSVDYMAGLSADIAGVVSLSARYNGEFSKPTQSITIGDQTTEAQTRVRTWMLSVGFHF